MKKWTLAFLVAVSLITSGFIPGGQAQAAAVLSVGSANGDVWDLQYRLRATGYYNQALDGVFGTQTNAAVRRFQSDYGLPVDGIVGTRTWSALKKFSLNQREVDILARVIYSEARGESYVGQVAVGAVVMNRIQSGQFGSTINNVVFKPGAFTAVSDGQFWMEPDATAYRAALDAVRGWDPTGGALYYFNPNTATSKWIWSRPQTVKIGHHIFAK